MFSKKHVLIRGYFCGSNPMTHKKWLKPVIWTVVGNIDVWVYVGKYLDLFIKKNFQSTFHSTIFRFILSGRHDKTTTG